MVKSELVQLIAEKYGDLPPQIAETVVTQVFSCMADSLSDGKDIEIRGLGTFRIKRQKPRWARNPKSGEVVFQSARNTIQFRPGKDVQQRIGR